MTFRHAIAAFLFATLALCPAHAATFFQLNSMPRDPIGQGIDRRIEGPGWTFQSSRGPAGNDIIISALGARTRWDATFAAADGAQLAPGTYLKAERGIDPGHPRLEVFGDTGTCYLTGSFVVIEIQFAADGKVTRFAADFEQHCNFLRPYLRGGIRYNSDVPYVDVPPPPPLPARVQIFDASGKFGGDQTFTNDDGGMEATALVPNAASVDYIALDGSKRSFNLGVAIASGTLVPGSYEVTPGMREGDPHTGVSGMVNGKYCPYTSPLLYSTGRFVVHEIQVGDYHAIEKLAVDLEFYCEGRGTPVQAAIRFNSAVPIVRPTPSPTIRFATKVEIVDGEGRYAVPPGGFLDGLRVAAVDDAGMRVPNQRVQVNTYPCGSLAGQGALELMSDGGGIVTLPRFTAPTGSETACFVQARLIDFNGPEVSLLVLIRPPGVPIVVDYVDSQRAFSVPVNRTLEGVRVRILDSSGYAMPNAPVAFSATCGSFSGSRNSPFAYSDSSGIATMPAWTAEPLVGDCTVFAAPGNDVGVRVSFTLHMVTAPGDPVRSATGRSPTGGIVTLSISTNEARCTITQSDFIDPRLISPSIPTPAGLAVPHGLLGFTAKDCGRGAPVTLSMDYPQVLPPGAQWWQFGPTRDDPTNHWYVLAAALSGNRISFTITDGATGDQDVVADGNVRGLGMLAVPGGMMQDLWWSGVTENGWGLSLVQHRDVLFGNLFVYDSQGNPVWYVMPSGYWVDVDHTMYTGNLYLPAGSPYYAYDVDNFDIGAPVGTLQINFFEGGAWGRMYYRINSSQGDKNISRIAFGPPDKPTEKPLGDLWWGGAQQNGWGLVVQQQFSSLFALWFTYDADGKPTWFVMPSGSWTGKDVYGGKIYRPVGSPWLGLFTRYDASRHRTIEVGSFELRFNGADAASFDYSVDGHTGIIPLSRIPF